MRLYQSGSWRCYPSITSGFLGQDLVGQCSFRSAFAVGTAAPVANVIPWSTHAATAIRTCARYDHVLIIVQEVVEVIAAHLCLVCFPLRPFLLFLLVSAIRQFVLPKSPFVDAVSCP